MNFKHTIFIIGLILIISCSLLFSENLDNMDAEKPNVVTLILTTTVDVDKQIVNVEQSKSDVRKDYYLKAIRNWLNNTKLNIVVVENSGYYYPELATELKDHADRFEIISFKESEQPDAEYLVQHQDKGAHEFYAIDYAIRHSKLVEKSNFIIKITGRYYVPDLENYIKTIIVDDYLALRQNNGNRCEMVGAHKSHIDHMFAKDTTGMYAESVYADRIGKTPQEKVIFCPVFEIEETLQGSNNHRNTNLFSNKPTL